jgi:hypothetical protein
MAARQKRPNRYTRIIEKIFLAHYTGGAGEVPFERGEMISTAEGLKIELPKNLGDVVYSFRYRADLPEKIRRAAPEGYTWIIMPAGRGRYRFVTIKDEPIAPREMLAETKIPDSTPGLVAKYSFNDEQALLARLRYNRLIDIFTGVTCYSLQNHLRTTVPDFGQVETDEIYVGVDRRGANYVFPVQAKAGKDRLNIVQILQDLGLCEHKFPNLIRRSIAAQLMGDNLIALFAFEKGEAGVKMTTEKHYRLVPPKDITESDLEAYRNSLPTE